MLDLWAKLQVFSKAVAVLLPGPPGHRARRGKAAKKKAQGQGHGRVRDSLDNIPSKALKELRLISLLLQCLLSHASVISLSVLTLVP